MSVLLTYNTGESVRLDRHKKLADMIQEFGEPKIRNEHYGLYRLFWTFGIGSMASSWTYFLNFPPGWKGKKLIRVEVDGT